MLSKNRGLHPLRIAHISDLHFSKISYGISQFFSKAWIGNLNLFFNRGHHFSEKRPYALIDLFKKERVSDVIISGDLTTTSSKQEFQIAKQFVERLEEVGLHVYLVPGNHDHYTKHSYQKKRFYDYFPSKYSDDFSFNLADHGVTAKKLSNTWWLILMDSALATPLMSSNGYFSRSIEESLKQLLKEIPSRDPILLVNHFPFFQHEKPKRRLKRGSHLKKMIQKSPNIQLYLHGHTHRRCVADLRQNQLPLILDSGSTAYQLGSWNLLELTRHHCHLTVFGWKIGSWSQISSHEFKWM